MEMLQKGAISLTGGRGGTSQQGPPAEETDAPQMGDPRQNPLTGQLCLCRTDAAGGGPFE